MKGENGKISLKPFSFWESIVDIECTILAVSKPTTEWQAQTIDKLIESSLHLKQINHKFCHSYG
jgi:hypothetical protein